MVNKQGFLPVARGLRVRVGIHSGIQDASCVVFNTSVQRTQYTGAARNC
jgi:hypothetical protein